MYNKRNELILLSAYHFNKPKPAAKYDWIHEQCRDDDDEPMSVREKRLNSFLFFFLCWSNGLRVTCSLTHSHVYTRTCYAIILIFCAFRPVRASIECDQVPTSHGTSSLSVTINNISKIKGQGKHNGAVPWLEIGKMHIII